jgi:hypothetical protein
MSRCTSEGVARNSRESTMPAAAGQGAVPSAAPPVAAGQGAVSRTLRPQEAITEIRALPNDDNSAALRAILERVDPPLPWMNEGSGEYRTIFGTPFGEDRKGFATAYLSRVLGGRRKKTTRKPKRKHFRKRTSRRT